MAVASSAAARLKANNYRIFHTNAYSLRFKRMFLRHFGWWLLSLSLSISLHRVDLSLLRHQRFDCCRCCCSSSPLICYSFLSRFIVLRAFGTGCKSLDLNALICVWMRASACSECVLNTQIQKNLCHFVFAHIYFTISSYWLIYVWFVHPRCLSVCLSCSCDAYQAKTSSPCLLMSLLRERWRWNHARYFHHIKFHRNSFVHKNIKPWIMSSCNHESTSNQLKITVTVAPSISPATEFFFL